VYFLTAKLGLLGAAIGNFGYAASLAFNFVADRRLSVIGSGTKRV
jgi:hypothetical protein